MLSIIVPVYKTEKYLSRCVDSLLSQKLKEIEIVLVDDGSPDGCPQICDEYKKKDLRVKVIHKSNEGLGMARNSGLVKASGDYVTFIDSDDYIDSDYLAEMYSIALKYNADVCVSGSIYIDNANKSIKRDCVSQELQNRMYKNKEDIKLLTAKAICPNEYGIDFCSLSSCFSLFKKSIILEEQLFFVSERKFLSEDLEFTMRLYQVCNSVYFSNIIGYHYWYNENSLSRSNKTDRFRLLINTCLEIESKLEEYDIYSENYRVALYFWLNFEKCINQEIRYVSSNKSNTEMAIKKMLDEQMTNKYIIQIYNNKNAPLLQRILSGLLLHKQIKLTISLLKIYNHIKH